MKQYFEKILIYVGILTFTIAAIFAGSLGKAKAAIFPTVEFAQCNDSALESSGENKIQVVLSEPSLENVRLFYSVVNGSATENKDFILEEGVLEFEAGETSANINPVILEDSLAEADETFQILLSNTKNANLGYNKVFTFTILSNDKLPATSIITNPSLPNGDNGWFNSKVSVSLQSDQAKIYYRWNKTKWQLYSSPINAPLGENILYYYAVNENGKESVKWQIVKVDTSRPVAPKVLINADSDNHIQLSWQKISGANYVEIWRNGVKITKLNGDKVNFSDEDVTLGNKYRYQVIAYDVAGNKSRTGLAKIELVKVAKAETPVVVIQPAAQKVVKPKIGGGQSITRLAAPEEKTVTLEKKEVQAAEVEPKKEESNNDKEENNWNRLLLTISILVIAAGAAIGGYYAYEWWVSKKPIENENHKSKSRW